MPSRRFASSSFVPAAIELIVISLALVELASLLLSRLSDHHELALGVAAETGQRDDDGQAVVLKEHQAVAC